MNLPAGAATQLVALSTGALLVTTVLLIWRRSLRPAVRLLAVQGVGLALLVATIGLMERAVELLVVALVVLGLKAVAVPLVLDRGVRAGGPARDDAARLNPTAALVTSAALTTLAYLVSRPVTAALSGDRPSAGPAAFAVPVGIAMVLLGFLLLATRRRALSQLVGFVVLDNGIATVAFLTAAGVPLLVELGTSFELLLIVLILTLLSGRMRELAGPTALDSMTELKD
jgi:hydrogenase-4 component E